MHIAFVVGCFLVFDDDLSHRLLLSELAHLSSAKVVMNFELQTHKRM